MAKDTRSHDAIREWKKTGIKPKGLKKVRSFSEAATKALRKAGRGSYELDSEK